MASLGNHQEVGFLARKIMELGGFSIEMLRTTKNVLLYSININQPSKYTCHFLADIWLSEETPEQASVVPTGEWLWNLQLGCKLEWYESKTHAGIISWFLEPLTSHFGESEATIWASNIAMRHVTGEEIWFCVAVANGKPSGTMDSEYRIEIDIGKFFALHLTFVSREWMFICKKLWIYFTLKQWEWNFIN